MTVAIYIHTLTGIAYLALAAFFANRLIHPKQSLPSWSKWLPFPLIGLHLYSLYLAIETVQGQDLSLFNILSLIGLLIVLLIALYRFKSPAPHLMFYACVYSAIAVLLSLLPHEPSIIPLKNNLVGIWHIWLAVIGFSMLLVAALQSILILVLNRKLRNNPASINPLLPPLMQMELLLFDVVVAGVITLGVALILGFFLPEEIIKAQALHKILLSVIAWFSFCTFIVGYKSSKISGIQFARYSLIAFGLLAIGFIGSKLVLELILQRG